MKKLMNLEDPGLLWLPIKILSSVSLCAISSFVFCLYSVFCASHLLSCFLCCILYITFVALFQLLPCLLLGFCSRLGIIDLLVFFFYIVSLDKLLYFELVVKQQYNYLIGLVQCLSYILCFLLCLVCRLASFLGFALSSALSHLLLLLSALCVRSLTSSLLFTLYFINCVSYPVFRLVSGQVIILTWM